MLLNLFRDALFGKSCDPLNLLIFGALPCATSVHNLSRELQAKFEWYSYMLEQVG